MGEETRSVEELLRLDTYQDMTDEEIELIIAYKIEQALLDSAFLAEVEERKAQQAIGAQILAETQYNSLQLVAAALNCKPDLKVIPYDA